jgi:two-component system, NarL family, sensor kinase
MAARGKAIRRDQGSEMKQRTEQAPGYSKIRRRAIDGEARIVSSMGVPRLGLRLAERSGLAVLGSTATLLRPARYGTGKINATGAAVWLAWTTWGLSMTLTALSLLLLALNLSHPAAHVFDYWVENTTIAVGCSAVGAVVASRCPGNPIGWIFCVIGLAGAVRHFGAQYADHALLGAPGSLPAGEAVAWGTSWTWVLYMGLLIFLALLFPNGQLPSSRWRWVAWLSAIVIATGAVSVAFSPGPLRGLAPIHNPLGIEGVRSVESLFQAFLFILGLFAATSLFLRLRNTRGVERQQLKWFTYATAVLITAAIPRFTIFQSMDVSWLWWAGFILVIAGLGGIPLATSIAILKYRLYDIDAIINRTLVYGALSASVVGIYMLVVGGLGALLQTSGNFAISLLATGLVAALFQPLRSRLQCGVNKLMYGERDEPYKVLSRLGRLLEGTLAPDATLTTIVETVAEALKLPYAAILLKREGEFATAAEHGTPVGEPVTLPLVHQKELVGRLVVAPRASGEAFTPSDQRLLDDLARQAGVAVHAARLTADLQRSRERLVTACEEERRRLRRDLHDGLGPTLAGLTFGLDAARNLLAREPEDAETLLAGLKGQTQAAVSDVRRLVYGLRPPALDDLGLVPAVREQAANHGLLVASKAEVEASRKDRLVFSVEAPEHLPPLPAAVEVACYRIVQEAMTNVARHARARTCLVRLSLDEAKNEALELEVVDDGVGISGDRRAGVGMTSMRERAAELGGTCVVEALPTSGTRVLARLPLPARKE